MTTEEFIDERLKKAIHELEYIIANDYADFMSSCTGIHRDFYYHPPVEDSEVSQ